MSYVEKTTSDVEKIMSDYFFPSDNALKHKLLQQFSLFGYSSETQIVIQFR